MNHAIALHKYRDERSSKETTLRMYEDAEKRRHNKTAELKLK